jgi:diguanylate cyclase (GGDEF)-like protein/PAS domain S-box-containing protein
MTGLSGTSSSGSANAQTIGADDFARRFRNYILLTWNLPPVFGLGFLIFIGLFTPGQILNILTTPLEPTFIIGSLLLAHFYFARYIRPVRNWLAAPERSRADAALACMRRFPLHYWSVFLGYLLLAPASVMVAAEIYAGYQPTPIDWFRIHLVALIVSIIVGLPIFFRILDLFGRALGGAPLTRPHVTIKAKVFLIGALVPLLIDTMLVQYFWTRTGYFTGETFVMWLLLEGLAIGGSLIFVRSFGQSLAPLRNVIDKGLAAGVGGTETPGAQSTDELGVLADDFRALLLARRQAEAELYREKELAQVTLASIGDGVITTDTEGRVTFLNAVAEYLTGWSPDQARGRDLVEVFPIINEFTRRPVTNPVSRCLREGRIVGLANHTVLMRTDGREIAIEDSAAPIRDSQGGLIGVVLVFHDVTRAREMANRLSWQATHDTLTGLYNRRAFEDRLHHLLQKPDDMSVHVLLYIDLDQFKVVNDIAGHTAGDEMLKQIAGFMQHQVRESDMLARLGGDEFGLILTDCDLDHANRVADKVHQVLEAFKFPWEGRVFRVGASIGVLEFRPGLHSLTELLSAADIACYTAKNAGRRRTHVYAPDDVHTQQHRIEMDWATRISEAVEHDRLVLFGQRIANLGDKAAPGEHFEVLVRLRDSDGQLVMPGVFLPAAERFDFMPIVDRWIITRSFSLVAECLRVNGEHAVAQCAINLSGATLGDHALLPFIKSQLALHHLPARLFCFEITETAAISNFTSAMNLMRDLRTLGFRFALDDFGSGMSSFSYLRNLPVDYLKIDGQFVRGVAADPVNRTLVSNINDIGHLLGKQTIAEYAEDDATLEILCELGVDHAQGFGIHRPEPLDGLLRCLRSS